jgi:undecaprenyl-diphosphatase
LSATIQLGSVLAITWYFREDILNFRSKSSNKLLEYLIHQKLIKSIFIGTIPIILLGGSIKIFSPYFFDNVLRSNLSIALVSFLMAIFMYLADNSKKGSINIKNHNFSDSFLIGFFQAFAIFPGVSRSGVTISSALISGWERRDAAKFSFLLGMPAISIAAIVEFISSFDEFFSLGFLPLFVGLITTFFSSLLAIDFLLKYFSANGLKIFIVYRVIFGVVILLNL